MMQVHARICKGVGLCMAAGTIHDTREVVCSALFDSPDPDRSGVVFDWQRVSSLAKVPPGDLVVKAVVGQSGGHADCRAKLDVVVHQCQSQPSAQENLTHVRGIRVGYGHAAAVVLQLP